MLTADHPNALWLDHVYNGLTKIVGDKTLNDEDRGRRIAEHVAEVRKRMSPDLIIHTAGVRLAAKLQGPSIDKFNKRLRSLAETVPVELDQILADDYYGITHGKIRISRGSELWERVGLIVWRFDNGVAVEHWQTAEGPKWDDFFQAGDPTFEGTALEFWTKES